MDHKLQKFMAVVELRSFTLAARKLHISQPALSMSIQHLEQDMGAELLIRDDEIKPSELGTQLYETCLSIKLEMEKFKIKSGSIDTHKPRLIRLGMIDSLAEMFYREDWTIDALNNVELQIDSSTSLQRSIQVDLVEAALLTSEDGKFDDILESELLGYEPMAIVSSSSVVSKKLDNFLSYNRGSNTERLIAKGMHRQGFEITETVFSSDPNLLFRSVLMGRGVTVLPYHEVEREIKACNLYMHGTIIDRPIYFASRQHKYVRQDVIKIKETCQRILKTLNKESRS